MREQTEKDLYAAGVRGPEYDEACKRVFQNREIIAPVLQMVVPEYKDCTVEEVIRCIDEETLGDTSIEDMPLNVEGLPTEMSSVTEKLIRNDIHFKSINPSLTKEQLCVHLHIDLEVQNDYRPGNPAYPVIKRAIYYAVRELSQQLGTLSGKSDYSSLEKVYSIWICNKNIPQELKDTATGYSIRRNDISGTNTEPEEDFDLLNVVLIRRGGEGKDKIFDYLNGVFRGELARVKKYTDIKKNSPLEEEVENLTGLGTSIYEEGIEKGIEKGIEEGIEKATADFIKRLLELQEPLEKITLYTGCTVDQVLEVRDELDQPDTDEKEKHVRKTSKCRR